MILVEARDLIARQTVRSGNIFKMEIGKLGEAGNGNELKKYDGQTFPQKKVLRPSLQQNILIRSNVFISFRYSKIVKGE